VADFQMHISVWSLVDRSVSYIRRPKHKATGIAFSHDGTRLAVAERQDCKVPFHFERCANWRITTLVAGFCRHLQHQHLGNDQSLSGGKL
jgi:hypothetical protein